MSLVLSPVIVSSSHRLIAQGLSSRVMMGASNEGGNGGGAKRETIADDRMSERERGGGVDTSKQRGTTERETHETHDETDRTRRRDETITENRMRR